MKILYILCRVWWLAGRSGWQSQVKAMMRSTREAGGGARDGRKATVLHSAVNSGSRGTFDVVLAALRERLTREEVGVTLLLKVSRISERLVLTPASFHAAKGSTTLKFSHAQTGHATLRDTHPPQPKFCLVLACRPMNIRCPRRISRQGLR